MYGIFKRIHIPRKVWWILIALAAIAFFRVLPNGRVVKPGRSEHRKQEVQVIDWTAVDESVRKAFQTAHEKACSYAGSTVASWMNELRTRAEEDFLPWYFAYWNQQALMLRNVGYSLMDTPLVEGLMGRQPTAEQQLGDYLQDAFTARVLHPRSAQLRIEAITREAVVIYLQSLKDELRTVKIEYTVSDQDWDRHLNGLASMLQSVEGNRMVPLVLKGMTISSGIVGVKVIKAVTVQMRAFLMRRASLELMEGGVRYGGRFALRSLGWAATLAFGAWDIYDHHRTVTQNKPVMRKLLNGYFNDLEGQILNDPQCGIFRTLDGVRQELAKKLSPI